MPSSISSSDNRDRTIATTVADDSATSAAGDNGGRHDEAAKDETRRRHDPRHRPPLRQELKVLITVVAVLLACEVALRILEERTSDEYRRIASFPERAVRLVSQPAEPRVLAIGNSLVDDGLKADIFLDEMRALGQHDAAFDVFAMPASEMCEWYWLFRSLFADRQERPDIVMLSAATFNDFRTVTISRLAAITDTAFYIDLLATDLPDFEERAAFLHSTVSRSFAGRDRVQKSILTAIVPHYKQGRIQQQKLLRQSMETPPPSLIVPSVNAHNYSRLVRFLDLADEFGVKVVLLAMPLTDYYQLDRELVDIIRQRDVTLLDCRRMENITADSFYDGVHLYAAGAKLFSRQLARRFVNEVMNGNRGGQKQGPDDHAEIIDVASEAGTTP